MSKENSTVSKMVVSKMEITTLTEQWRNGTLPNGKTFWCQDDEGNVAKLINIRGKFFEWTISEQDDTEQVKEVLAPVPTYDQFVELTEKVDGLEWRIEELEQQNAFECECNKEYADTLKKNEQLEKKLDIAVKALEKYAQCKHLNLDILAMLLDKHKKEFADFEVYEDGETARKALKELKEVK